jgi:ATP-binding cassette subfamily B protein
MEPGIADRADTRDVKLSDYRGEVRFENVSFRYADAEEDMLRSISFAAMPGQTTAIIGPTGSGKSTLIHLIPRFFDVSGGKITIDGVDIRDLSQKKLRSLIGFVPQKGILFSGDIESNIKFGGDSITDADMIEAAEIAQAAGFIAEKEDKYQSAIAQGGTNVSGGQRQRLSIARAIAKQSKILLFDDSFSALDYNTDVTLRRALSAALKDATVLIVAQRISTILHADQIIVLDEGQAVGIGTHRELMKDCPAYQEIARSQLSDEELKGGIA